jgi:hypothetical protein
LDFRISERFNIGKNIGGLCNNDRYKQPDMIALLLNRILVFDNPCNSQKGTHNHVQQEKQVLGQKTE